MSRAALALALGAAGCLVRPVCLEDRDCGGDRICLTGGTCGYECTVAEECGGAPWACEGHRCTLACDPDALACPAGMASVCGAFCADLWEASRPDATSTSPGVDGSAATSREGVIPWFGDEVDRDFAAAACAAAGKRLCEAREWGLACGGVERTAYAYGDAYDPSICNGIDTYCTCDGGEVYPHCYETCGADFHVEPTGAFASCVNAFGMHDVHGNVWEVVDSDDGLDHFRGGAFNCKDSEELHACDYDATWGPSARGFRCCADGEPAR